MKKALASWTLFVFTAFSIGAVASTLTLPYPNFQPGTTIYSAQVNANNTATTNLINGGLDHTNLTSNAGITISQLGLNPGGAAFNKTTSGGQTWGSGLTTDSVPQLAMFSNQGLQFGPGGSGALDVELVRSATNTLQLNNTAGGAATLDMNNGTLANLASLSVPGATIGPASTFGVTGTSQGSLQLFGLTSGSSTIGVNAVAGTSTFHLPVGNGSSGQALETDGSGNTSWQTIGTQVLFATTVNLTASQINGMYVTPVQLVPAQGAGLDIVPSSILFKFTYGGTAFGNTNTGANVYVQYGNTGSGGGTVITNVVPRATMLGTASFDSVLAPLVATNAYSAVENTGLYLTNLAGAYTGGAGTTVAVTVFYTVK